ncbi:MAG: alpha-hydroxy-acid oxidizing protein [Bryobacteraceae bacterium]|jgi:isopentenyl diphosphate isomerase/L-lactate dehydrogenase-like FMN-dependent dehydrogenase
MSWAQEPPGRIPPARELINTFEFEAMAQRSLNAATFAEIAGSDRTALERITFRPRMMVNTAHMDLTAELFGQRLFAPILVGPVSEQKRFHPEGELASVRGASAAKTLMVVSSRASYPLQEIAAQPGATLWYQVYPETDTDAQRRRIDQAVALGCKALCITIGGADWSAIDRLRQGLHIPCVLKGIMSPEEARAAIGKGIDGIVVSNYGAQSASGMASPIEVLPAIAEAVAGKVPILIDGSFRLGSDILKALALGARAVMLGRPPLWALAAYGSAGVETMLGMLQTELARDLAMCGKPDLKSLDPSVVKIHLPRPSRP